MGKVFGVEATGGELKVPGQIQSVVSQMLQARLVPLSVCFRWRLH